MSSAALFSIVFAFIGVIFIAMGLFQQRKLEAVRGTQTVPIGSLAAAPPGCGRTCEIKGIAEPGPAGPLRAPMSGRPCVWFEAKIVEYWKVYHHHPDGRVNVLSRQNTLRDNSSPPQISVADQTGVALLDFRGTRVDPPIRSFYNVVPAIPANAAGLAIEFLTHKRDHILTYSEVIVPPGHPIYALGRGGPHPQTGVPSLSRPDQGPFIVSTQSEEQYTRSRQHFTFIFYILGGLMFVGGGAGFVITFLLA